MREYLTQRELQRLQPERIKRLQDVRFAATCRHMLPLVPFYRSLFDARNINTATLRRVEDWHSQGLPLLKKAYFRDHPKEFVVSAKPEELFKAHLKYLRSLGEFGEYFRILASALRKDWIAGELRDYYLPKMPLFSGGTESGKPTPVLITMKQKQNMMAVLDILSNILLTNLRENENTNQPIVGMNLFPYGPHLAWHAVHHAMDIAPMLNLSTAAGGAIPTERLVKMAAAFKPNVIAGMADYVKNRFLPLMLEQKAKVAERVVYVNGGTKMYSQERDRIAELFKRAGSKAVVLDVFGASEFKEALMPECAPGTGFHQIAPLSTIFRTVSAKPSAGDFIEDWDFTELQNGGYAVVWNIDGAGTLLEGYLIGDKFGKVETGKCKNCGLNVDRVHDVTRIREVDAQLGFTGMAEEKIKGARIDLSAIRKTLLSVKEVKESQIILRGNQLTIRLATSGAGLARAKKALSGLEVTPKYVLVSFDKLIEQDKLKFRPIIVEK